MDEQVIHRVVVGVDGSTGSHAAVEFAAEEAQARQVALHLVCAYLNPVALSEAMVAPYLLEMPELSTPDPKVPEMLARIAEDIRRRHPGLQVIDHAVLGRPTAVLVKESRRADLMVVGARGHGGFAELLVGSVATQVTTHASCPVIVVRGTSAPTGPVVVGIDASHHAELACEFAFAEAAWRGVGLRAIHAWAPQATEAADTPAAHQQAEQLLAERLAGWQKKYPQVTVEESLITEDVVVDVLVDASDGASLIVVGSRGHGTFASLLLGSVSYALARHAHCPVAIIRAAA